MPATVIVGLQWGDEGKGKTTDFLAEQVAMVVRYQGGDNAGHTVVLGDEVFKLQLSRRASSTRTSPRVIGPGVVVNPATLIGELDMLDRARHRHRSVRVSRSAHVIMPYHVALDGAMEARLDGDEGRARPTAGSARPTPTGRGASVCAWRTCSTGHVCAAAGAGPARQERCCSRCAGAEPFEVEPLVDAGDRRGASASRPHLDRHDLARPGGAAPRRARPARGRPGHAPRPRPRELPVRHLVEPGRRRSLHRRRDRAAPGRRGHRRDEGLRDAGRLRAVPDGARTTTIGAGIAERGHEFGTTTGRPRRVGWFDAVPLRYAVAVNSVSSIMLNKLDILSGLERIRLCVAYEIDGRRVETLAVVRRGARPGDARSTSGSRAGPSRSTTSGRWPTCPRTARRYVDRARGAAGVPDRARVGRAGADPDDRAGLAADAPPSDRARRAVASEPGADGRACHAVMPTRILDRRRWRPRARARLEAGRRAGREPGRRRAGQRGDRRRAAGRCLRDVDPLDPGCGRRARPRSTSAELVVIGPEAPLAAGVADALGTPASPSSGRPGPPRGSRRARRSATRWPRRPASGWPRPRRSATASRRRPRVRGRARGGRRGVVVKADGLAAGKGVVGLRRRWPGRGRDRRALLGRARPASRRATRAGRRGAPVRAARRASSRVRRPARGGAARPRATTSACATATAARTPAAWAPTRPVAGPPEPRPPASSRDPPADPRRARPPRDAVPRRSCTPA